VRLGRALPQRDQDRRPNPLTPQRDNTTIAASIPTGAPNRTLRTRERPVANPIGSTCTYFFRTK
jgi:hypothetical protein